MKRFWLALAAGLLAGCGAPDLTFEAKVADLHKPGNHLAYRMEPEAMVKFKAPGKMLDPLTALRRVTREQADWSTAEHAAESVISANVAGDLPWVVRNFVFGERLEAGRQLQDPMAAARTRAYFLNLGAVKLMGWAEFGDARIMFLRGEEGDGDPNTATMVLAKTGEGWRQTTSLGRDDRYDVVVTALQHGGVK